jgi:hypothetical protein
LPYAPPSTATPPESSMVSTPTTASGMSACDVAFVASVQDSAPLRTHLQGDMRKPKIYSDGTTHYAYSATSGESYMVQEAPSSPNWKSAMVDEYNTFL